MTPDQATADRARDDGHGGPGPSRADTGPAGVAYARATATALPFEDQSFDAAIACLVFEHIEGTVDAISEVGRVLRPGGTFLLFMNHPLLQVPGSGWVDDDILGEQYWRIGPYLQENHSVEEVDKNVWIPFVHRPLSVYVNASGGRRPVHHQDDRARPAGRFPREGRGVPAGRRLPPPARLAGGKAGFDGRHAMTAG